jgi:hypothetical protein
MSNRFLAFAAARYRGRKGDRLEGSYNKIIATTAVSLYQKDIPVSDMHLHCIVKELYELQGSELALPVM